MVQGNGRLRSTVWTFAWLAASCLTAWCGLVVPAAAQEVKGDEKVEQPVESPAVESPVVEAPAAEAKEPAKIEWIEDYDAGMAKAEEQGKMLWVYFQGALEDPARKEFESSVLSDADVLQALSQFVCVRVPVEATIQVDGQPQKLLEHRAFESMLGRQGVAMIDWQNKEAPYYGCVTSVFPFTPGLFGTKETMKVMAGLPPGTLTQRTLILAVRLHPERPESTDGAIEPVLILEAEKHSRHQASIRLQGHHQWESRFHQINAQLPHGVLAQEVVAESWPGQHLVEAAIDCVHSWRQSPGHWNAVRGRHRLFGYDMKRGSNGIWYATGLFSEERFTPVRNLLGR